jgi:GAF domain-containing protein
MSAPEILERLLEGTKASRTTLRLEQVDGSHPVVAEALAPGVRSIAGDASINLRDAATFKFLDREHRPLVQGDLELADDPPPPELIARYGARSQMLAPIVRGRRMIGFVSVHCAETREWTAEEIGMLEDATAEIDDGLRAADEPATGVYQEIVAGLLEDVAASRTTLRLDVEGKNFPAVAEALAPGVPPIKQDESLDQRGAATAQWLMRTHEILVQDDCASADPPPPQALLDVYGVKAQMLAPIVDEGRVVGWISVHYTPSTRPWTERDVAALRAAAGRVEHDVRDRRGARL